MQFNYDKFTTNSLFIHFSELSLDYLKNIVANTSNIAVKRDIIKLFYMWVFSTRHVPSHFIGTNSYTYQLYRYLPNVWCMEECNDHDFEAQPFPALMRNST